MASFLGNGTIADVYVEATKVITGGELLTLLGLFIIFVFIGIANKLSFEVIMQVTLPMMMVFFAYNGQLKLVYTVMLIALGYLTAKYMFS